MKKRRLLFVALLAAFFFSNIAILSYADPDDENPDGNNETTVGDATPTDPEEEDPPVFDNIEELANIYYYQNFRKRMFHRKY